MGGKESKFALITYDEAAKKIQDKDENECSRLKDAFKRCPTPHGLMPKSNFMKDVLGETVPSRLAERIYTILGGNSRGLSYKDLICGLALIRYGTQEERVKFLFTLYANETGQYIQKEEMDALVMATEGHSRTPEELCHLLKSDRVTYEEFKDWQLKYPEATSMSRWLLKEDEPKDDKENKSSQSDNTPTFYQTLTKVTHLEEDDFVELEKRYWHLKSQSQSGRFDLETLKPVLSPPVPADICEGLFNAFDENHDNHIDFKEMACGISACCRGPDLQRQRFCFKVFDDDQNGLLGHEELTKMLIALDKIREENCDDIEYRNLNTKNIRKKEDIANDILKEHDGDKDGFITQDEYLLWTTSKGAENTSSYFLELLFQICHVVLGLKPENKEQEKRIVEGWLKREERKGLQAGQCMYLITSSWWDQWQNYVKNKPENSSLINDNSESPSSKRSNSKPFKHKKSSSIDDDSSVFGKSYRPTPELHHHSPSPSPHIQKRGVNYIYGQKPGAIDNSGIVLNNNSIKVATLTNEGGLLKKNLQKDTDFKLVPDAIWRALHCWYNGQPALPRSVIVGKNNNEVELYPINVKLYKHQVINPFRSVQSNTITGMVGSIGGAAWNAAGFNTSAPQPKRFLAHTASFSRHHTIRQLLDFLSNRLRTSREDIRLWKYRDEIPVNLVLLEDEDTTVEQAEITDGMEILIEVRNKDLTWPEEMLQLARNKVNGEKKMVINTEHGATGLNNLGNTCFLNSAVQCVSNTKILKEYFTSHKHKYELNKTNILGMKGHIASAYGELVQSLWSGTAKTIAPLKLRYTISKYAPRFNSFQQQDSQELLQFFLDGLHEDLNRVHDKPFMELKDSDGRPDDEVAEEAWNYYLSRNRSIIIDLFHGQLRSRLQCPECKYLSVKFDPLTFLSLPLPMENYLHLEILVIQKDGSLPTRYGLRLDVDEKYDTLKKELSKLCKIPPNQLLLIEVQNSMIKNIPHERDKLKSLNGSPLFAYELPPTSFKPLASLVNSPSLQRQSALNTTVNGLPPVNAPTPSSWKSLDDACSNTYIPPLIVQGGEADSQQVSNSYSGYYVVAMHRKMLRQEVYFLANSKCRPSLFGTPLIIDINESTSKKELYEKIMTQMSRLVSQPNKLKQSSNHALNGDDSNKYPFTLKTVCRDGTNCDTCEWYRFCKGCEVTLTDDPFDSNLPSSTCRYLAIDWEPNALHLRYQSSQEKAFSDHESVSAAKKSQTEPIDLDTCLKAFTKVEVLPDTDKWLCPKCKKNKFANKELHLWKLPPILIVHLKRFVHVDGTNGKFVKSHKIVNFPLKDFDPWMYSGSYKPTNSNGATNHDTADEKDVDRDKNRQERPKYDLYALSCHSGMITGGHYVSYAKNTNGKWYCYNDSSCKEVPESSIDKNTAYMLFYEKQNLDPETFMPDVSGKEQQTADDEEIEEQLKKGNCTIM